MSDHFWLCEAQLRRIKSHFPLSHGVPRVDDRKVVSGIIHVIRNGLRWRDAPEIYGPHKTLYNRFIRWSKMGVFDQIFTALVEEHGPPDRLMIDATHLKVVAVFLAGSVNAFAILLEPPGYVSVFAQAGKGYAAYIAPRYFLFIKLIALRNILISFGKTH